jgi:hypothetical protein
MLTSGEQGLRKRWAIFKAVDQFTVSRLRNRLRIGRLYGVNGHRQQSHGRKAGILSDQLVKANDCQQKKIRKSAAAGTFFYTPSGKKITLFALVAHDERKPARITPRVNGIRAE